MIAAAKLVPIRNLLFRIKDFGSKWAVGFKRTSGLQQAEGLLL
jgi:hypothetical protein